MPQTLAERLRRIGAVPADGQATTRPSSLAGRLRAIPGDERIEEPLAPQPTPQSAQPLGILQRLKLGYLDADRLRRTRLAPVGGEQVFGGFTPDVPPTMNLGAIERRFTGKPRFTPFRLPARTPGVQPPIGEYPDALTAARLEVERSKRLAEASAASQMFQAALTPGYEPAPPKITPESAAAERNLPGLMALPPEQLQRLVAAQNAPYVPAGGYTTTGGNVAAEFLSPILHTAGLPIRLGSALSGALGGPTTDIADYAIAESLPAAQTPGEAAARGAARIGGTAATFFNPLLRAAKVLGLSRPAQIAAGATNIPVEGARGAGALSRGVLGRLLPARSAAGKAGQFSAGITGFALPEVLTEALRAEQSPMKAVLSAAQSGPHFLIEMAKAPVNVARELAQALNDGRFSPAEIDAIFNAAEPATAILLAHKIAKAIPPETPQPTAQQMSRMIIEQALRGEPVVPERPGPPSVVVPAERRRTPLQEMDAIRRAQTTPPPRAVEPEQPRGVRPAVSPELARGVRGFMERIRQRREQEVRDRQLLEAERLLGVSRQQTRQEQAAAERRRASETPGRVSSILQRILKPAGEAAGVKPSPESQEGTLLLRAFPGIDKQELQSLLAARRENEVEEVVRRMLRRRGIDVDRVDIPVDRGLAGVAEERRPTILGRKPSHEESVNLAVDEALRKITDIRDVVLPEIAKIGKERKVPSAQEARTPVEAPGRQEGIEGREEGRLRVRDVTQDRLEAEAGEVAERRVRPAPEAPMKDVMSGPFKLPGLTGQFVVSTERGGTLRFFAAGGAVEAVARRQADGSWRPATGIMALSQERIAPLQGIIENAYQLTEKARAGMPAERKVPRALPLKTQEGLQRPAEVGAQIQPEARAEAAEVRPLTGVPVRAAEKPSSPAARMLATEERVRRLKEERPVRQREEARAAAQALKPIGDIKASVAQAWAGSVSTEAGRLVSDGTMAIDTAAISEADATKLRARPSGTVQRVTQKAMEDVWKATMRDAPHAARPVGLHSLQGGGGVQGGDVVVLDLGEGKAVGLNPKKYAYLKRILGAGVTLYGRDVKSPIVFKKAGKPVALLMPVNIGEEIDLTPRGGASRREGPLPGGQAERARILRSAGWTPMPFSAGVISRPGLFPFLAQTLPAKAKETIAAVKKAGRERGALSTILSRLRGDKGTGSERQRDMVRQFNSLMDLVQADPENAYRLDRAIVGESPVHDLPLEAQHWVRNARRLQDEASNLLIDELIMSYGGETKLTESIHRNLGTYLHETLIPESASQRLGQFAARKLKLKSEQFKIKRDRWIVQFGKSFEKFDTEAEARGFYQDMIHQRKSELIKKVAKARGVTADDLKRAAANAKGKIKLLPPIPEEARREIFSRNPIYQWSVSYAKTVHNAATLRTFRLLERRFSVDPPADVSAGGDKAVEEWAKENKLEKLTAPRETIGVLHGKYVPKRVAKEVNELVALPSLAMRIWRMYLNLWKSSKTIYNPPTHVRNILGNVPFADIASIAPWNPTNWKHYLSAARELSERGKDYRWLLRQGVVGSEYFGNEIRFVVKLLEGGESPFDVLTHRIHQAHGVAGRIYNIEDQIFKVAAYKKYRDKGMAPLAAAREVNRWFPNYGDLLRTTRWLSQIPLGGPFLAFNEQAARIAGRAAVRHPIKLLKWASLPGLLSALSIYWLGMDEEEEELLDKRRSYLEPVLPVRDDKGAARTFDLRYMTPLGNEVMGLLHKERIEVPMFLSQPLIGSAVDVMSNRDLFTGKNIVGEDDPAWTKLRKRAWHVLKDAAPVPTTVTWGYERVRRAFQGEGREGVSAAIAGALFGINTRAGYVQRQDAFARLRALAERDPEVAAVVEQLLGGDINRMNYKQLERDLEANEAFQELLSLYNDAYRRENQKPISGRGVLQSIRARNRKAG